MYDSTDFMIRGAQFRPNPSCVISYSSDFYLT
uniref:Uncharacterized protein n=1 Tax=Lepeophtheirus salmonis TaxID=72036 RepID=A0A0K2TY32_LEPSM